MVIRGAEIRSDHMLVIADTRISQERKICSKAYEHIEFKEI